MPHIVYTGLPQVIGNPKVYHKDVVFSQTFNQDDDSHRLIPVHLSNQAVKPRISDEYDLSQCLDMLNITD
jgi:hypothetical protein